MKATGFLLKCQNYFQSPLLVTKWGGGGRAYIGHPMCETTIKPNILAITRDKEVIHQNEVGWH